MRGENCYSEPPISTCKIMCRRRNACRQHLCQMANGKMVWPSVNSPVPATWPALPAGKVGFHTIYPNPDQLLGSSAPANDAAHAFLPRVRMPRSGRCADGDGLAVPASRRAGRLLISSVGTNRANRALEWPEVTESRRKWPQPTGSRPGWPARHAERAAGETTTDVNRSPLRRCRGGGCRCWKFGMYFDV